MLTRSDYIWIFALAVFVILNLRKVTEPFIGNALRNFVPSSSSTRLTWPDPDYDAPLFPVSHVILDNNLSR